MNAAQLDNLMGDCVAKMWDRLSEENRDVEEFRAIDFGRLMFDKEYQRRLDEHFGDGWMDRIKWVW
jgi:hypothetical protein